MRRDVFSTLKSIEDSGVDIAGVAAVDLFVKIDWVDSSCLFSDTTLEWTLDMATIYVAVVEGLDSSAFPGLFFGILNFLTLFRLLDVPVAAIASVSSFPFKKKATKRVWLLLHEGGGIQRVAFMWGRSKWVGQFPIVIKRTFWTPTSYTQYQCPNKEYTCIKKTTLTCLNQICK